MCCHLVGQLSNWYFRTVSTAHRELSANMKCTAVREYGGIRNYRSYLPIANILQMGIWGYWTKFPRLQKVAKLGYNCGLLTSGSVFLSSGVPPMGKKRSFQFTECKIKVFSRNIMRLLMLIISLNFVFCQSVLCYINGVRNMDIRLYLHIGCVYFSIHNLLSYVNTRINFLFLGTWLFIIA